MEVVESPTRFYRRWVKEGVVDDETADAQHEKAFHCAHHHHPEPQLRDYRHLILIMNRIRKKKVKNFILILIYYLFNNL